MIKKILSLLLCFTFVFGLFNINTYAQTSGGNSIELLQTLDIGDFSETSANVSRAQFVSAVSDIINYNSRPLPKDGVFSDVTKDNKYSGGIYSIYEMGFISGYGESDFGADDNILYEQAVKILVSALGYDTNAKYKGGYPTGYLIVAASIGLTDGINKNQGEFLTQTEAAYLIENAINTEVLRQTGFGDTSSYEATEGHTFLYEYAKIQNINGVVTDNGITSLTGESRADTDSVVIGGYEYDASATSAKDYLGFRVNAYVTCDLGNHNKVLYISPDNSCKVITISAERLLTQDPGFTTENIVYEDVYGKLSKAKVSRSADVIYNGKAYADLTPSDMNIDFGEVILVDNTGDTVYDTVIINAVELFVVDATNLDEELIYPMGKLPVNLSETVETIIYRDGAPAELSSLKQWDVVRASISLDKSCVTLDVSSRKLTAKIEGINSSLRSISINGKLYHAASDELVGELILGNTYELCLDTSDNIVCIKGLSKSAYLAGVVIQAAEETGLDASLKLRIFAEVGRIMEYACSEKIVINGQSELSRTEAVSYIEANMKYKFAGYRLNSANEICEIYLPYKGQPDSYHTEDSLRVDYDASDKQYWSANQNSFGGKAVINTQTVFFQIPKDSSLTDEYKIVSTSSFDGDTQYDFDAYSIGVEDGISDYIVLTSANSDLKQTDHPIVVSKISTVINADGEAVECIKGYDYRGEVTRYAKEADMFSLKGISVGDVVRCSVENNDTVVQIEKIVDSITKSMVISPKGTFFSSPRLAMFNVYYKYGNVLGLTTTDLSTEFNKQTVEAGLEKQVLSSTKIYIVDTSAREVVRSGTSNDIYAYKTVGSAYSKIFLHTYSGASRLMVVYR